MNWSKSSISEFAIKKYTLYPEGLEIGYGPNLKTYCLAGLGFEDRWAGNQGFPQMVVIIGTLKGISDGRPAWSFRSDLYLDLISHIS